MKTKMQFLITWVIWYGSHDLYHMTDMTWSRWPLQAQLYHLLVQIIGSTSSQPIGIHELISFGHLPLSAQLFSATKSHFLLIQTSGQPPLDLDAILPLLHLTLSRFDIFEDVGDADGVSHRVWTPDVASAIVVTPKIVKLTIFITT